MDPVRNFFESTLKHKNIPSNAQNSQIDFYELFHKGERCWFHKAPQAPSMHCGKNELCGYSYRIVVCWLSAVVFVITVVYFVGWLYSEHIFYLLLVLGVCLKCWGIRASIEDYCI